MLSETLAISSDIDSSYEIGFLRLSDVMPIYDHLGIASDINSHTGSLHIRNGCIISRLINIYVPLYPGIRALLHTSLDARVSGRLRARGVIAASDIGLHIITSRNALVSSVQTLIVDNSLNQAVSGRLRARGVIAASDIGLHIITSRNALVSSVQTLIVDNSLNQAVSGRLRARGVIAASDIGLHIITSRNALVSSVQTLIVDNSLNQAVSGRLRVPINVDYMPHAVIHIVSAITDHANGMLRLHNAIDMTGIMIESAISWWLDGRDITNQVIKADINLYGKQILSDARIIMRCDRPVDASVITCVLHGRRWQFLAEDISHDIATNNIEIWGRTITAQLYTPYQLARDITLQSQSSRACCETYAQPYQMQWSLPDYLIRYMQVSASPLELIETIVKAVGGELVCLPDDVIRAVYPLDGACTPVMVIPLHQMLSCQLVRKPIQYDAVQVVYGAVQPLVHITCDKTQLPPGEWAHVRVYCLEPYTIHTTADELYREVSSVEQVEEEVELVDGTGNLKYPVLSVIEITGCPDAYVAGQTVHGSRCRIAMVRYTTRYDGYKVTSYTARKDLVCSVTTGNSVMVSAGTGDRVLTIDAPIAWTKATSDMVISTALTNIAGLAMMRARKEFYMVRSRRILAVDLPYEDRLAASPYVWVDTPYGRGLVQSASINITNAPLRIKQRLEIILS